MTLYERQQASTLSGGNVRFTSSVVKQRGSWVGIIRWREDGKEKRKTKTFTGCKTKTEAKYLLKEWEREINFVTLKNEKLSFYEYAKGYVSSRLRAGAIETATADTYYIMCKYINDAFGSMKIDSITRSMAQSWINKLAVDYSTSTVRKAYNFAKAAFQDAIYDGLAETNPFERVSVPKLVQELPNALDATQRKRLKDYLAIAGLSQVNTAIMIALYTGMRQGEICALQWRDVDFDNRVITVSRSLGRTNGKYILKATKTDKVRTIPIPSALLDWLRAWETQLDETAQVVERKSTSYVIGELGRGFMRSDKLGKEWHAVAKSMHFMGTEGRLCTFHDLRHTYATAAITNGVDVKTVSSILGHANAAMTLNIYASADPDAKQIAARKINDII